MTLTQDLLKKVINSATNISSDINAFIESIQEICGIQNTLVLRDLKAYLAEEYGITSAYHLSLASIDIKNDICDFVNTKAA